VKEVTSRMQRIILLLLSSILVVGASRAAQGKHTLAYARINWSSSEQREDVDYCCTVEVEE
jgi:hypothetical protein